MPEFDFRNRQYVYGDLPLPESITADGRGILAEPARLALRLKDGGEAVWNTGRPLITKKEERCCVWGFSGNCADANLIFDASLRVEDDGFAWCDVTLIPKWYTTPDFASLALEIPLKKEFCSFINAASLDVKLPPEACGFLPENGIKLPFVPSLWIGGGEAGVCVSMESDRNMLLSDENSAFEVEVGADTVLIRVHLLDSVPEGWDENNPPVVFSFGLQVTPVKEYREYDGFERTLHVNLESLYNPLFDKTAEQGIKYIIFHENWTALQNYGLPYSDDEIRSQVGRIHEMGMKALAYFGYEYPTLAPDFARTWDRYLVRSPDGHLRGGYERFDYPQRDFIVCANGGYAPIMQDRVVRTMEEYGFDGIYTDGTMMIFPCANEAHGCGWRDRAGKLHYTFPILAWRDHMRKLYKSVADRGGIFDSHNGGFCYPALYAFTDTVLDGEADQELVFRDIDGFMNSGRLRSQYSGRNLGIPVYFIIYHEELIDPLLVLGIKMRFCSFTGVEHASRQWKRLDAFGAEDAEFHPAYDSGSVISADGDKIHAACWIKTENGVRKALAAVYNASGKDQTVGVTCLGSTSAIAVPAGEAVFAEFREA